MEGPKPQLAPITSYSDLVDFIDRFDVESYSTTRNYFSGNVSGLSPYISRGVISTKIIKQRILSRHELKVAERFIYQLAWRDYFQQTWWLKGNDILSDINKTQHPVSHFDLIKNIVDGATGIQAIDAAIHQLTTTGTMHNHARMYVASLFCNLGRAHWKQPSRWMYYHLLDGDIASNSLSWQWVAGTFCNKKYFFNQENLNRFSEHVQTETFLDTSYEHIAMMNVPEALQDTVAISLATQLPQSDRLRLDERLPLLIYNTYILDPLWRRNEDANRVLLLEPSHFEAHPISEKVLAFILQVARWIKGLQIFVGEFNEIPDLPMFNRIHFKDHPLTRHYRGTADPAAWMFEDLAPQGSFTKFWKQCAQMLVEQKC